MKTAIDLATESIKRHEGLRLKPYRCTAGKLTIGFGRNLDDVGITTDEAETLLHGDIAVAALDAQIVVPSFDRLDPVRQAVLIDMVFNLGRSRLSGFKNMIAAVEAGDFEKAANEMLDSRWASQVGNRAVWLAERMRKGYV